MLHMHIALDNQFRGVVRHAGIYHAATYNLHKNMPINIPCNDCSKSTHVPCCKLEDTMD